MQRGAPPNREAILKKFDKDGDGKLSEEERAEVRKSFSGGRPPRPPAALIKKFDKDGDGKLNKEEQTMFDKSVDAVKGLVEACKGIDDSLS